MKVGFIGLGIMGRPMAEHLQADGHELFLHDLVPLPQDLVDRGAVACASGKEVAEHAEIVVTMLPDTPQVEAALFGPGGVAEGLTSGKIVVDMSSISPLATREFAQRINQKGCDYLDAPVAGSEADARQASLTIMVGGPERACRKVGPLLERMGNVTVVGGNGAGQTTKVAHQMIVAITMQAVAEALLFASKAGADPARVREALMGGFAGSRVLEVHGERMIRRDFEPGFRIDQHRKDLSIALAGARALALSLPGTASANQLLHACAARGGGAWDHSAMVRALELLANYEVGQGSEASEVLD